MESTASTTAKIGAVVSVAFLLVIGIYLTDAIYASIPATTTTVTNETFVTGTEWSYNITASNSSFIQLSARGINNASISVTNYTTGIAYPRSDNTANVNWTMNDTMCVNGTIMLSGFTGRGFQDAPRDGVGMINNSNYNISYTYTGTSQMQKDVMTLLPTVFRILGIATLVMGAGVIIAVLNRLGRRD